MPHHHRHRDLRSTLLVLLSAVVGLRAGMAAPAVAPLPVDARKPPMLTSIAPGSVAHATFAVG